MVPDDMGFRYPMIDSLKCVECKLCERSCPVINCYHENKECFPRTFAAQLIDERQLKKSQSGAAFYAIAKRFLEDGGKVYGAAFDSNLEVRHIGVGSIDSLDRLRMSKYVQSDMGSCFKEVTDDLKSGKKVLFSGTPCQIAGLSRIVPEKLKTRLYTVDLICHGVPGPEVYRQYLGFLENRYHKKIDRFVFRDKKSYGWRTPRESVLFEDGEKKTFYYYNFLFQEKDLLARPACGNCRFCSLNRTASITIGDCWGWEKLQRHDFEEDKGISLLIANDETGRNIIESLGQDMKIVEVPLKPNLLQRNLQKPTSRPPLADKVAVDFARHGFGYIHKKYGYTRRNLLRYRIIRYQKAIIKRINRLLGR